MLFCALFPSPLVGEGQGEGGVNLLIVSRRGEISSVPVEVVLRTCTSFLFAALAGYRVSGYFRGSWRVSARRTPFSLYSRDFATPGES